MFRRQSCGSLHYNYLICFLFITNALAENNQCSIDTVQHMSDASSLILFLDFVGGLLNEAKGNVDCSVADKRTSATCNKPIDCADVYNDFDNKTSGVYKIWPTSRILNSSIDVFCDMEDGGGWTVFQRRGQFGNPKEFFYQNWNRYKLGFGDLTKEFWLGNDNLFALTNQRDYTLKIVLEDYDGTTTYATYNKFWVADEVFNYTLHVTGYAGTTGDALIDHSNLPFSTYDKDNDKSDSRHCAKEWRAAWWYHSCYSSNLNGIALRGEHPNTMSGINWKTVRGDSYSFKNTVMKIKPSNLYKNLA